LSSKGHTAHDRGTGGLSSARALPVPATRPSSAATPCRDAACARHPYIAINPGASFAVCTTRSSIISATSGRRLLLCLHEEAAVAIAHGYAKVTGRAMAAAVHSNVGLLHATMAMFNAWCDRMPVLVIGATGPVDAQKRRPWIDWIHTARDQGAIVRGYTKWDDQPGSAGPHAKP
jgi:hypothetical protein